MSNELNIKCYKCANTLKEDNDFGRQDSCLKCGSPTHCCLNCTHYDRSKYNECAEPIAERVVDKEKSNFCDLFKAGTNQAGSAQYKSKDQTLKAAEALFNFKKPK